MAKQTLQEDFLKLIASITNKRAKIVIDHIVEHGFITTEDLETTYGYSHPPRAARDVREAGIPLETFTIKSKQGKSVAAYKFGDLSKIRHNRLGGRLIFSKEFKKQLYEACDGKCAICNGSFELRYLQIDHRVPYEIMGDFERFQQYIKDYMLLCASCNRAKSWSCEHCKNWTDMKDVEMCKTCYWGNPDNYDHIALEKIRRLELTWQNEDVKFFETLKEEANNSGIKLPDFVKLLIESKI